MALATLAVSLDSSAYSGGITQIIEELHISMEVATLGVSLFVVGFAIGKVTR
jgi:MFS family permease